MAFNPKGYEPYDRKTDDVYASLVAVNTDEYLDFFTTQKLGNEVGNYYDVFENESMIAIIGPDGIVEEIKVNHKDFHRKVLYARFAHLPGVSSLNEYITATIVAKNNYIVIIGNICSLSIFLPSELTDAAYYALESILSKLGQDSEIYVGVALEEEIGMKKIGEKSATSVGLARKLIKERFGYRGEDVIRR